jgi:hypothetical protein
LSNRRFEATSLRLRTQFQRQGWHRSAKVPDAPTAASGGPEAPNRPADPPVLALRPSTGTPSLVDSLHNGQAGEQQASCKIHAKITGRGYTVGKQCLERPHIVLSHPQATGSAAHQYQRSAVIK